jgi:uncharacterized membrane protein (UPF0127 family)
MGEPGIYDSSGLRLPVYCVRNITRGVDIARRIRFAGNSVDRRKGLLGVCEMQHDTGLWIRPCEAVHTFGMKIPIDVVFLDRGRRVKKVYHDLRPNRIAFCLRAESALELRAGRLNQTSTLVNDTLEIERLNLDASLVDEIEEGCPKY